MSGGQAAQAGGGLARPAKRAILGRLARAAGVVLAAAAVSFAGIGSHSLWTPDEPRDAAIGKAMWASGDPVVPRLNGRPFLEKPPLAWWAQAAAFQALGVSDAAARVPAALFGTLTLLAAFALGRRLGGPRAGWLAAGALASTAELSEDMGRAIVDPALVLMVTLAYTGFALLVTPRPRTEEGGEAHPAAGIAPRSTDAGAGRARRGAYLLIALAVPLAFLAKGIVGIGLALGPPVLYLLAAGRRATGNGAAVHATLAGRGGGGDPRAAAAVQDGGGLPGTRRQGLRETVRLLAPLAVAGVPLFAAIVLPWALALLREGGWAALRECLVGNTVGRLLATEAGRAYGHRQPFWYYLPAGAAALFPWSLALPAMLRGRGRARTAMRQGENPLGHDGGFPPDGVAPGGSAEAAARLLTASFFIGVLLLSLAASKRALYLVPLLPAIAVPIGLWLDSLGRGGPRSRWDRPTALLLLGLAALLPAALWAGAWEAARGAFRSFPVAPLRAELSGGRLAIAGVAAAAGAVVLLLRLARHLRGGTTPTGPWLVVPLLAVALVYQTAVKAAVDPLKNPHDLTAAIARLDPGSGPVAVYRPSETILGIVDFDLGRRVEALAGPAELAAFLGARPEGKLVLSLADWRRLPAPLRARLGLLYDETPTKASPYAVAAGRRYR
ncbi:MAG TPA: glycosyltransferase family 39 protein [Thermoanaerobaculia bacterium]|nr:glycosyltransferase family 39 protein [Thermoanaerobaculia bacterium]